MAAKSRQKKDPSLIEKTTSRHRPKVVLGAFFAFAFVLSAGVLGFKLDILTVRAASVTVCASGCDYTSLTAAIGDATPLVITIEDGFVFDDAFEDDDLFLQADTTIQCEPNAVYGDAAQDDVLIWPASNNTIQDCTFENVSFDTTFGNGVYFYDNTFSDAAEMSITLTGTDGFEIVGNVGLQHLQIQAPLNGLIEDNELECRFSANCIGIFNDTPENIEITNNLITNYNVSQGNMVDIQKGTNIDFTNNTLSSAVIMDDILIRMLTVRNDDTYVANNYFVVPERPASPGSSAWAIEALLSGDPIDVLIEHNTIVDTFSDSANSNDAAVGLSDSGAYTNVPVTITAEYNLYYKAFDATEVVRGFDLEYTIGSADLTFTDSYNGLFGVATPIFDSTGTITSLNANTVYSDPLLRTENVDTTDDLYPSPISRYFDVDGALDIGAYPDARVTSYLIDASCVVDYATCFSNGSYALQHAVTSGDTVTVGAGTYDAVTLDFPASGVTFAGAGATTIFDAGGTGSGMSFMAIDSSDFSDFQVEDSASVVTETYELSHILLAFGGDTYDESAAIVGFPDTALVFTDDSCTVALLSADNTDVTAAVGAATDDWNIGLVDVFGFKLTTIFPDRFISSAPELVTYAATECGSAITVDLFLPSVFAVSGGEYSYVASVLSGAGASLKPGLTTVPPTLEHLVDMEETAGLLLVDSDGNTFTNVTSTDSSYALGLAGTSSGNSIEDSLLLNSSEGDIFVTTSGDNDLVDTVFDRTSVVITGSGETTALYSVRASVTSSTGPIDGADVTFTSADLSETQSVQTDGTGLTPYTAPLSAYVLSLGDIEETSGGLNPYSAFVEALGYPDKLVSFALNTPEQTVPIQLSKSGGNTAGQFPGVFTLEMVPVGCSPDSSVQVRITGERIAHIALSNDPLFTSSTWQPFSGTATTYPWTLTPGDGRKTIYGRVRSAFGNVSTVQTIDVELDEAGGCEEQISAPPEDEEDIVLEEGQILIRPGGVLKAIRDTVYYYGRDGLRHVFPDVGTYFSWFLDFTPVLHITQPSLDMPGLGPNVTYRPGSLIKFLSPEVYLVVQDRTLRHIVNEQVARALFGPNWAKLVHDLSDVFATNYRMGEVIRTMQDLSMAELEAIRTIDEASGFAGQGRPFIAEPYVEPVKNMPPESEPEPAPEPDCPADAFNATLSRGMTSAEVERLQKVLTCLGYLPATHAATNFYGTLTQSAVEAFQRESGLSVTGSLDAATRAKLNLLIQ